MEYLRKNSLGRLTVYWGPMFSGKTTQLIKDLLEAEEKSICFKPKIDNRYGVDEVRSHDGFSFPATPVKYASDILLLLTGNITTVGIDEGSLFENDETFIPTIKCLLEMGFNVIVSGLDMTSEGEPFNCMAYLAAIADECKKFKSTCCDCKQNDSYISFYIGEEQKTEKIKVGGNNLYIPLCKDCAYKRRLAADGGFTK